MRRLLATLAVLLALSGSAFAQAVIVPSPVPALTNNCTLKWQTATSTWVCSEAAAASQPLTDTYSLIADGTDATKILAFQLSGLTTGTTRTWTIPDANLTIPTTIASLATNTFTGLQTLNGGLATTTGTFSSTLGVTGAISSAASVALTGTTNNLGTITSGIWNAGAVTSSGTITVAPTANHATLAITANGTNKYAQISMTPTGTEDSYFSYGGNLKFSNSITFSSAGAINAGAVTVTSTNTAYQFNVMRAEQSNQGLRIKAGGGETYYDSYEGTNAVDGAHIWTSTKGSTTTERMRLSGAGLLTVSGFGMHTFSAGGTGANTIEVVNTTDGAANYARLYVNSNASTGGQGTLDAFSAAYTTSGPSVAGGLSLTSYRAGGLSIAATHASGAIRFYTGGTTLQWTLTNVGALVKGTYSVGNNFTALEGDNIQLGSSSTASSARMTFYNTGAVGSITTSGSATAYNTSSDARLKANPVRVSDLSGLLKTKVYDFDWRSGGKGRGVFAQEAYLVMPRAVSVGDDAVDTNGRLLKPWSVDYSKYVPDLIAGWQLHESRIAALEAKLARIR